MSRPKGTTPNLRVRQGEWALVRRTASLGDIIDEATFAKMLGVTTKRFRHYSSYGEIFGIKFPVPIARPDGTKPIWLKQEADEFMVRFTAARKARGR